MREDCFSRCNHSHPINAAVAASRSPFLTPLRERNEFVIVAVGSPVGRVRPIAGERIERRDLAGLRRDAIFHARRTFSSRELTCGAPLALDRVSFVVDDLIWKL